MKLKFPGFSSNAVSDFISVWELSFRMSDKLQLEVKHKQMYNTNYKEEMQCTHLEDKYWRAESSPTIVLYFVFSFGIFIPFS